MNITEFSSLYSKEATGVIDANEWMEAIRDGKYKTLVEQIRTCVAEGRKDDASALKMKLPAVVFAGDCRRGRFYAKTTDRTGWAMFDFDNLQEKQITAARDLITVCPWVVMIHVTSSGRGLRIVVNIGKVHIDVYRDAYERVAEHLKAMTGMEPDMQCKDFARTSLASYDPQIYYNPQAEVFDYGEGSNPLKYVPVSGPDTSEDFRIPDSVCSHERKKDASSASAMARKGHNNGTAGVDTGAVTDRFFSVNSYTEGSRHRTLLRLGGYLRWRGVEPWQLDEAVSKACARAVQPGMPEKEVRNAVVWGYNHGEEGGKNTSGSAHCAHFLPMNFLSTDKMRENADNQGFTEEEADEDELINKYCSTLPDEIFSRLPKELADLLVIAKDKRERDVILLSSITVLSGMFPALRTIYGNQKYSPHLYMCFVAEAGAGKGAAMYATTLGTKVSGEFEKIYRAEKKGYDRKLLEWEMEVRNAFKEKRLPDLDLKPEEPARQMFILQPNTSKSQILKDMMTAKDDGAIMVTSEIDSLAESLNTDYGKHTAELRMFFHHEQVGQRYKTDKDPVVIENPRLALLMAGTPEQLVRFIKNMENGMYSRFLFYMMSPTYNWKSQSPLDGAGDIDVKELFGSLAEKLKVNFFNTRGKEVMINFTREQWDRHAETFQEELGMIAAEDSPNSAAIVKRAGLIMIRVAMVLCGLRIMEAGWQMTEYTCTDEDFDTAMKIILTGMGHSTHISTMIAGIPARKKISNFYKLLPVLKSMKNTFRYYEFRDAAVKAGSNVSAARRALDKYVLSDLLSKVDNGFKKKDKLKRMSIGEK